MKKRGRRRRRNPDSHAWGLVAMTGLLALGVGIFLLRSKGEAPPAWLPDDVMRARNPTPKR